MDSPEIPQRPRRQRQPLRRHARLPSLFWNSRALAQFNKQPVPKAPGNNDETFNDFNAATWPKLVRALDQVLTSLEDLVAHASEADLARWAPTLANISTHNAYHTGQILYVRKLQGVWDPTNGVK